MILFVFESSVSEDYVNHFVERLDQSCHVVKAISLYGS